MATNVIVITALIFVLLQLSYGQQPQQNEQPQQAGQPQPVGQPQQAGQQQNYSQFTLLSALQHIADAHRFAELVDQFPGVQQILNDSSKQYTLFVPTDNSWEDVFFGLIGMDISSLLKYHIVDGVKESSQFQSGMKLDTFINQTINVTKDQQGKLKLNSAEIVVPDVRAKNGIIDIISTVLVPPQLGPYQPQEQQPQEQQPQVQQPQGQQPQVQKTEEQQPQVQQPQGQQPQVQKTEVQQPQEHQPQVQKTEGQQPQEQQPQVQKTEEQQPQGHQPQVQQPQGQKS